MAPTAFILGISGQDGAYLAHYLLTMGYKVIGTSRDAQHCDKSRLERLEILSDIELCSVIPTDFQSVFKSISENEPDEIYNLSGLTSVGLSFEFPRECTESICSTTLNLLEAIRIIDGRIKFFNAGSTECFGNVFNVAANEATPFNPLSPYAAAKASAFWQVSAYRRAYKLYCCTGILSNHESPLRPNRFVSQKLVKSAWLISENKINSISLGNLNVYRDWGWAPDYVKAMYSMLHNHEPKDYIIASGLTFSLEKFAEKIFSFFGLNFQDFATIDKSLVRDTDIEYSFLDPQAINDDLQWTTIDSLDKLVEKLCTDQLF